MQVLLIATDRQVLQSTGADAFQPLYADDLEEAIHFLYHIDIDMVVIDLGCAAREQMQASLKALKQRVDLPILALVADPESGDRALSCGAQDFLLKDELSDRSLRRMIHYCAKLHGSFKAVSALSAEVERLRSRDSPFRSFFANAPVGMVLMDLEGRLVRTNRALQRMLERSAAELRDQHLSIFIYPEDSPAYMENLSALQQAQIGSFEIESRFQRKSGELAWWRITLSLLGEGKGEVRHIFGLVKDVSRWKKSEVDLQKAKELAEAMTRTKSEFLANLSHEIRTPIHTITGMVELLLETELDMEQAEYAGQIRFSVDVLLSLVNDILDFSKIEAGKLNLETIDFDLYEMLENAVDLVVLEAHRKNLEVILEVSPDVPHLLRGDPARLRQIVVNLFNNAVKFTPAGEIHIVVTAGEGSERSKCSDGRCLLRFAVRDTGIGIGREKMARLFRSFSQADSSTTRKYGGTGLGLSISRSLVEMMGGEIGVESEEGKGSLFWFTVALQTQAGSSRFGDLPDKFFDGLKVLAVDDNASARGVLKSYLEVWGCRVGEVESGERALEEMRRCASGDEPYALVCVDLRLPGMDGWQLASEVNADRQLAGTRLILMTPEGLGSGEAKMKLLKWFDGYLSKPVKRAQLLAETSRVLTSQFEPELLELESADETAQAETPPEAAAEPEGVAEAPAPGPSARILVVEDHEVNQQLFKAILQKLGYRVFLAEDGLEALEAAGKSSFDLIFMDIQMPNLNGYDATRRLREMGIRTPIIAVTASALQDELKKAVAAGMDDCLTKPFKKKDLLPVLSKYLAASELGEPRHPAGREGQSPAGGSSGADLERQAVVFDYGKTLNTFMGREDVLRSVLSSFLEKVKAQLASLSAALQRGDLERLCREAHSIKGGAWNLEARPLGEAARLLEEAGKEGDRGRAEQALQKLNRELDSLREVILPHLE